MKELLEYREKLIRRLGEAAQEFRVACEAVNNPFEKIEDGWTLHQTVSHVRDTEKVVYGERIYLTLNGDNPEFKDFDADKWMEAHYDPQEPLERIFDEFTSHVSELCKTLSDLPQEAWSLESRHETQGSGLTLQLWVERCLAHIEEHLQAVKKT